MARMVILLTVLISFSHSQNMVAQGLWKIGGALGVDTYSDENNKRTLYFFSPEVEHFLNQNMGVGLHARWYRSAGQSWSYQELLIMPSVTFVTEKPYWPFYISAGPTFYTNSDAESISDHLLGWFAEGGLLLFLNEHVALIPKYSFYKDSEPRNQNISRFSLSLGYYFRKDK